METDDRTWLDLYDYRQRVSAIYRQRAESLRLGEKPEAVWRTWRDSRDDLFAHHPQSALGPAERATFTPLQYFPYDPAMAVEAVFTREPSPTAEDLPASHPHPGVYSRAGTLIFDLAGVPLSLVVYWVDVYGGGLILPFRDTTGPTETYGAGRYLFDTVKGSDFQRLDDESRMGYAGGRVLLDFNYAYNPSCAYDPRWACPLAPRDNWLPVPIRAGELNWHE